MDCGMHLVKFLLFGFNLVCSLAGVALIVLGALAQTQVKLVIDVLDSNKISAPAIVLIVVGSIVFVLAFLGCCGAAKESHCMLITYAVLLCCIFIVQVVIAALAFVYRKDIEEVIEHSMEQVFLDYNTGDEYKETVDDIQGGLKCCGVNGPSDWFKITYTPIFLPDSCCETGFTQPCNVANSALFKGGCLTKVMDIVSWSGNVIGGIAIGVAVIELIGIIFACFLANSIKNESRRRYA